MMATRAVALLLLLAVSCPREGAAQNEKLLQLLLRITPEQFYAGNELLYRALGRSSRMRERVDRPAKMQKIQKVMPDSMPFPCDVSFGRSPERPTSVHRLRPGDIDVIGAMGDSLTAAYGALAVDVPNVYVANRGVSWSGGGQSNWRQYLTLPNILKEFNPNLVGYSLGDALTWQKAAQFNVAEGGAISSDLPHQAKILVKRMKTDPRVDFKNDWKLVTMFIGGNDFCFEMCYNTKSKFMSDHFNNVLQALDILHDNIPRLLVNYMPGPNLEIIMQFTAKPATCVITHRVECPCIVGERFKSRRPGYVQLMREWQDMDMQIGKLQRYKDRDDFALVIQPFSKEINFPQKKLASGRNVTDYSYLSADCFHFSQKCGSITANALWNNMLEPVGKKALDWNHRLMETFHCPTRERPYIFTDLNSAG